MEQAPTIIDAGAYDSDLLADIFTDAFAHDPVLNWLIPATSLYPRFFRLLVQGVFLPRGYARKEAGGLGATMWLPPGEPFQVPPGIELARLVGRLALAHGPRPLLRILNQGRLFDRHRPKAAHFHLVWVGVRREHQGRGHGAALMKSFTAAVDSIAMPAYLESSNERNLALYRRHGFEVIAEDRLPDGGPRVWFMWREAR